jgi:uncharacterized membrane protein (DUF441 family)
MLYLLTVLVVFIALVAALYAGVVEASKLVVAIKDAATLVALALGAFSGILARKHLTPDPE